MVIFDLETFIKKYVIKRPQSMFYQDIEKNREELSKKIQGKSILVIGGAGFYRFIIYQGNITV